MSEEAVSRRLNRRTRSERTKRRERYLLSYGKNNCDNILASSTDSHTIENNNCDKGQVNIMGNKPTVDILFFI